MCAWNVFAELDWARGCLGGCLQSFIERQFDRLGMCAWNVVAELDGAGVCLCLRLAGRSLQSLMGQECDWNGGAELHRARV